MKKNYDINNFSKLFIPTYLMCFPFNISTEEPNNIWMEELKEEDRLVNKNKAFNQFLDLYNYICDEGIVYIIPAAPNLQDQVYTANLGCVLPHLDKNTVIISKFKSKPRIKEEIEGIKYFHLMRYKVFQPKYYWEGEAELKYVNENNYIGGYGIRSSKKAYEWMEKHFDMNIVKVKMTDTYLYHLDCLIFPINSSNVLACTKLLSKTNIKNIEKFANIIDVSLNDCYGGITNSVRLYNTILNASSISSMQKSDKYYLDETRRIAKLNKICAKFGLELSLFDLSEFTKSGALLSCMIMHLNYRDYKIHGFTKEEL